ncbi:hypothetical protein HMPREF3293_02902 [Christensenella minuta]|uniref:Uncharacterized protein n=1 Tax=Christensenella minuta TaxID=626937 RepID=A0A136Q0P8_9FIRM|nr:hypothetical protein HMPREF3293_02902 [Christensenella minuta]
MAGFHNRSFHTDSFPFWGAPLLYLLSTIFASFLHFFREFVYQY